MKEELYLFLELSLFHACFTESRVPSRCVLPSEQCLSQVLVVGGKSPGCFFLFCHACKIRWLAWFYTVHLRTSCLLFCLSFRTCIRRYAGKFPRDAVSDLRWECGFLSQDKRLMSWHSIHVSRRDKVSSHLHSNRFWWNMIPKRGKTRQHLPLQSIKYRNFNVKTVTTVAKESC